MTNRTRPELEKLSSNHLGHHKILPLTLGIISIALMAPLLLTPDPTPTTNPPQNTQPLNKYLFDGEPSDIQPAGGYALLEKTSNPQR